MVQQILRGLLSYSIATGFTLQPTLPFGAEILGLIESQYSGISAIQGVLSTSRFKDWLCATAASSFTNLEHLPLFGDFHADGFITVSLIPSLAWLSVMRVAKTVPTRARDTLPPKTTMPMQEFEISRRSLLGKIQPELMSGMDNPSTQTLSDHEFDESFVALGFALCEDGLFSRALTTLIWCLPGLETSKRVTSFDF
jgi:hypothetical protein